VPEIAVLALDVGSLANIGWWRMSGSAANGGRDIQGFVEAAVLELNSARPVAIGFEAPLFIPSPSSVDGLARQRIGEAGRPWCAGAGSGALALGVQQASYVLEAIRSRTNRSLRVGFDPAALTRGELDLCIWEAFVSGKAKNPASNDPHVADARSAAEEFHRRLAAGIVDSDIDDRAVLNLVAAGIIAAGLTDDVELLKQPCVVVKAPNFGG
jgi:hypothetical protein